MATRQSFAEIKIIGTIIIKIETRIMIMGNRMTIVNNQMTILIGIIIITIIEIIKGHLNATTVIKQVTLKPIVIKSKMMRK